MQIVSGHKAAIPYAHKRPALDNRKRYYHLHLVVANTIHNIAFIKAILCIVLLF